MSSQPSGAVELPPNWAEVEAGSLAPRPLRGGDVVSGVVAAVDYEGVWVSIGSKYEGLIPPAEFRSADGQLGVGQELLVYVYATAQGRMLLSYDRARRYLGWQKLEAYQKEGQTLQVDAVAVNKGGMVVRWEGIEGFIPLSEAVGKLQEKVGKKLEVKVLEVSPRQRRLILSERQAYLETREREKAKALSLLQEGEKRPGKVTGIQAFGVFIDVGGVEGLCPLSELSWERDKTPEEVVKKGQAVEAVVVKIDQEAKKLLLSLKRATPHPWETVSQKYKVGQRLFGTVTRLLPFGALARVDGAIEGLIHISELSQRRISHPKEVVREGQVLPLKIISIDPEKRQLRLSLRQAQEEESLTLGMDNYG